MGACHVCASNGGKRRVSGQTAPPRFPSALADQPRKRGRPLSPSTKQQVAIRFDRDVLAALRATGPGWQTRVNDVMREWVSKQAS